MQLKAKNVDAARTSDNITYKSEDLQEKYHEIFDEALEKYNAKKRSNEKIHDYYEHIRKGKQEKSFYEVVVQFGDISSCGLKSGNWETAKQMLDEYMRSFEERKCFCIFDGTLSYTPISEVDLSGYNSGVVSTIGDYGAFLQSLNDFSVSEVEVGDLDDLSNVLPTEKDPSLTFPVNPVLDKPISDQAIVGDIAGVKDMPLSDYMSNAVNIDISVPSVIVTKFPWTMIINSY
ncbi:MAG: plasmid recombination protein [Oscillospiraceae bacterium]|nr:plasmid recombination protein [Oscillospiraceae bacterium]